METVFTIVARNYVALANILGDSLKKYNPTVNFFIVVADSAEDDDFDSNYDIVKVQELKIAHFEQLAFKYNVTELCTAIKPTVIKHLFNTGHSKVIYFDPDILIFSSINSIFQDLDPYNLVLTPHYVISEQKYTGLFREGNILFAGIFNLGFCAIKNSTEGFKIIEWWESRLMTSCYADKVEGLHVDQKWMDFVPSFFEGVKIERGLGYNVAIWNWHEREILCINDIYHVKLRSGNLNNEKLIFFHYSNFHFKKAESVDAFMPIRKDKYLDILPVSKLYASLLVDQKVPEKINSLGYRYNYFDNGELIVQFQRRLYRRMIDANEVYNSPFKTDKDSYYILLKKNGLLSKNNNDKLNEMNYTGFGRKLTTLNTLMRLVKIIIGFDNYSLLCKFMFRYVRPENQAFLIKQYEDKLPFTNENRYINV